MRHCAINPLHPCISCCHLPVLRTISLSLCLGALAPDGPTTGPTSPHPPTHPTLDTPPNSWHSTPFFTSSSCQMEGAMEADSRS